MTKIAERRMDTLTTGEAALVLRLSLERVRQLIIAGRIPAERLNQARSHRRIRRADLQTFADNEGVSLDWTRLTN